MDIAELDVLVKVSFNHLHHQSKIKISQLDSEFIVYPQHIFQDLCLNSVLDKDEWAILKRLEYVN